MRVWALQIQGDEGKRKADYQKLDKLLPLHPEFPLNGGVIFGSPEALFRLVVIKKKLGI